MREELQHLVVFFDRTGDGIEPGSHRRAGLHGTGSRSRRESLLD
jgi:hypothetical protein